MGYFLQLRILLWKNFTLKKRTPLVLLFEICIPLVLFVILLGIRLKQPPKPVHASHYTAQPLPSAGVLPIMQQFCEHGWRNEDGFAEFRNNTLYQFLENLQSVAEDNNFFSPGFTPDEMDRLPDLYRSIIDDPAMVHDTIINAKDVRLGSIFDNVTDLQRALTQNFSLSADDVDVLVNSKINFTEVYNLLFGTADPQDTYNLLTRHKRAAPKLVEKPATAKPTTTRSTDDTKSDPRSSFLGGLSRLSNLLKNKTKLPDLDLDPSKYRDLINDALSGHDPKASLPDLDWDKIRALIGGNSGSIVDKFGHGLIYDVLQNDPTLLLDPEVRDVIATMYGFSDGNPDPREVVDVLKKLLLSPAGLRYLLCQSDHELGRVLIPPEPQHEVQLEDTERVLCAMSQDQWRHLSTVMKSHVNATKIVQQTHLNLLNYTVARQKVSTFKTNVQEFVTFEKNMLLLSEIAANLPQSLCNHDDDNDNMTTTQTPPSNSTGYYGNTTHGDFMMNEGQHSRQKREADVPTSLGMIQVWISMQKTVCGHVTITDEDLLKYEQTNNIADLGITDSEKYRMGILAHALYSNPRVLYAPNETSADTVIAKANETFGLVELISDYATRWLNVSGDIRAYLSQNSTRQHLESIREMQRELRAMPDLVALIHNDTIEAFIHNATVPPPEFFLDQLDIVDNAACSWLRITKGFNFHVFKGFRTEEELVEYFLNDAYDEGVTVFASVVFTNLLPDGSLPPHVVYKIRQNASFTPTTQFVRDRYWHPGPNWASQNYFTGGFVWIQDILERAVIDVQVGHDVAEPGSYIWTLPSPCYVTDHFLFMIEHVMPLCLTISWVYTVAMLVQNIVYEKEQRLKEVMRMMGLNSSVHWLAWFITTFTQMSVTMAILTAILKYGRVLHFSNVVIVFMVLEVFGVATIAFSFLVSVCYSKAKVAAACAGILYFLSYVPYMYIAIREEAAGDRISAWAKSIASLFSTTGFGLGAKYFAFYEIEGVGVQWGNINHSPVEGDQYNLFLVTLMMVIDALIYFVLTWYIENVHPGSYGLPKPWYFPVTRSYWLGHPKTEAQQCSWRSLVGACRGYEALSVMEEDQACALDGGTNPLHLESEPAHLPLGVQIDGLSKTYKTGKLAVNRLSLNLYEGHITSFLGHNGAGKTTTMSILTGLFPPTSGSATIYNNDIRTDMEEIRKSLGMCPQHNVLFDKLTVEEHLWFYARLKGVNSETIKEEMETMIQDVGLPKKRHNTVDCLSGGMQRKLSVAIAFVGGSQTVILDEPTAGVDPYARRAIWDLLVKYKQGRTILLSTHHMDEADILGDRIAIISHGQLKCCGSSLFLKNMFGDGYHLMVVKKPSDDDLRSMDTLSMDDFGHTGPSFHTHCTEPSVTAALQRHVPTVYLQGENHRELHYVLPFEEAKKGNFERLFRALDRDMDALHISSYGVMDTTLEEVFLKVTEDGMQSVEEENESNDAKEESMSPAAAPETQQIGIPVPAHPQQTPADKDEASLSGGSILLGSNTVTDLELGNLATRGHARSSSGSYSRLSQMSRHEDLLRLRGHQRNWSGTFTRSGQHVNVPQDNIPQEVAPPTRAHRRSMSGSSWTPRLAQATMDREATLTSTQPPRGPPPHGPAPRGHRRAWSGSSWSRLSQFNGPMAAQQLQQAEGTGRVAGPGQYDDEDEVRSVMSDGSDVSLLEVNAANRRKKGHHRTGSDVSMLDGDDLSMATLDHYSVHTLTGSQLQLQQFMAIIVKRYYYIRRNWRSLFSQILLPAMFVCIAMTVALSAPKVQDLPPITISPAQYYNYTQPTGNYITYRLKQPDSDQSDARLDTRSAAPYWESDSIGQRILNTLRMPAGVAATCVLRKAYNGSFNDAILRQINKTHRDFGVLEKYFEPSCASVFTPGVPLENFLPASPTIAPGVIGNDSKSIPIEPSSPHPTYYPSCECSPHLSTQVCNEGGYTSPPGYQVITGDHLLDISGQEEEEYYLNTYDLYRLNRYGGLSLGKKIKYVPESFGKNAPAEFRKLANRDAVQVRSSTKGFHAMPTYINVLNNAILRANLPKEKGNPSAYGITAINHPMNNTNNGLSMAFILQGSDVLIAIFVIVAMSFVPASFVVFLVYERSIKAKHLQVVSGANRVVYWCANYVWDMCNYIIPATCCILILKIFDIPAYVSGTNFPAVISLFLLYGWSITPMMYPATFWFREPSSAYIALIVINLFIGITCIITSFLLELFQTNDPELKFLHEKILKNVFLVFPNYCLGRGLMDIAFNEYWNEYFFKTGQYGNMRSPFQWTLMSRNLVAMAAMGIVFFLITLLCEFNFFRKPKPAPTQSYQTPAQEDPDVADERRRVLRGRGKSDMLRLENLTQIYVTKKLGRHLAVDRLCLGVPQGECFGLLGVNGAGKTTTFKMLTGDLTPTGGDAILNSSSVLRDIRKVQKTIGYCPQFDALYDELTAREHLQLYARLRGIAYTEQKKVVDWAIKKLGLQQVADNLSMTYSGGNKRKLSTAIALIGNPPIILLDEPTTGMDPHSRRFLWDLILTLVQSGRSVILTSHSMEECEALCTRLAIMVNGQFQCLGSSQHLKSRFGDGYTVSVRVRGPHHQRNVQGVRSYMDRHFPNCTLKESHHNMVQYELPSADLSLSALFSRMEEAAQSLNVEDYSVSQNTLDNVFINFVAQQQELVRESGDGGGPVAARAAAHDTSSDSLSSTELQPLAGDTGEDDELLGAGDEWTAGAGVRSRVTFVDDVEPINC